MFLAAVKDLEFLLILKGKTDPVHTDRIIRKAVRHLGKFLCAGYEG